MKCDSIRRIRTILHNDRFVLSKGHAAPLLYSAYAESGIISEKDLLSLRRLDSISKDIRLHEFRGWMSPLAHSARVYRRD